MRGKLWIGVLGVCTLLSGCGIFGNAARNMVINPLRFCECIDRLQLQHEGAKLAEEVWNKAYASDLSMERSVHYERGFKEGFVDYYVNGGPGNPPPIPPRDYWKADFRSPEGHQSIQDWLAGFQDGAQAARDGGYRQFVVVPTSVVAPDSLSVNIDAPAGGELLPPPEVARPRDGESNARSTRKPQ